MDSADSFPANDSDLLAADALPLDTLHQLPATIWTVDRDLVITSAVGAGLRRRDWPPNATCGNTLFEHFQTDDATYPQIAAHIRALKGETTKYEGFNGAMPTEVTITPLRDADGEIVGAIAVSVDISHQLRAESAARVAERRYRDLVENAADMMYALDRHACFTYLSQRALETLGYEAEELLGRNADVVIAPEDDEKTCRAFAARMRGENVPPYTFTMVTKSGRRFPVEINSTQVYDADGNMVGTQAIIRDISARMLTEQKLHTSEEVFRQFAENIDQVVWVTDASRHNVEYVSPAFDQIWGRPRHEIIESPETFIDQVHPDDREIVAESIQCHRRGESAEVQYRIVRPDGAIRWISDCCFPIRDASGRIDRVAGIAKDITDRKSAEQRQTLLMRELSHRVKNNLASVMALAQLTAQGTPCSEAYQSVFASRIRALDIAHDVIVSARHTESDVRILVETILSPFRDESTERIDIDGPRTPTPAARAAPFCLVINELTTNAVKFGALACDGGHLSIKWTHDAGRLSLMWAESGCDLVGDSLVEGTGIGLIRGLVRHELRGTVNFDLTATGLTCTLSFPVAATT